MINRTIKEQNLNINDFETPIYILDAIKNGSDSVKKSLRSSQEIIFEDDEIEMISKQVYNNVYNHYFKK